MDGKMTLEEVRDKLRKHGVVAMTGNECFALADAIDAHIAQPAQAVDVGAIQEAIAELGEQPFIDMDIDRRMVLADKLTRAIGNAQAEGLTFAGLQVVENADVPDGEIWIYDKSKITTKATPNAHE